MLLIFLGLVLWFYPHLMKSLTPGLRASMPDKAAKGLVAVTALLSIVLMVIGYRTAEAGYVYTPPEWGKPLNNLLMLIAVAMFGVGHSKSRLRGIIRHPMFLGTGLWAVSHLLVRGDGAAVLLFGGLLFWSIVGVIVAGRSPHQPAGYTPGGLRSEVILAVITLVIYGLIVGVHFAFGLSPFS
tara:strand:- start:23355 stop:23903 length:549 start_codon:yes stop_codon:yes gene_type:complete